MILVDNRDGYYDENGNWKRTKLCFMHCGSRCTCSPPGGIYFRPPEEKKVKDYTFRTDPVYK